MLTPFTALLPRRSGHQYWALERAAKALRRDPARYQSVEGIEYHRTEPSMFAWRIEFEDGHVDGLVGAFPLEGLVPHEAITPGGGRRPRHPVQIRPVMALVDDELPDPTPVGATIEFLGDHRHLVTPVEPCSVDPTQPVIADGHHRVAAALRTGGDPLIMTMLVSTRGAGLDAGAFHRVFATEVDLPAGLPGCVIHDEPPNESLAAGRISVVTGGGAVGVEVTDPDGEGPLRGLPAGLAARYVVGPLGLHEGDAEYVDDIRKALEGVESGATAILLPRSELAAVIGAARSGLTLPPKSTRFRPKPIRGLMLRPVPGL